MNKVTATTLGIEVSVEPRFHPEMSKPSLKKFVHSYKVSIKNFSGRPVQLLRREWIITDAHRKVRVVKGEGVIGEQPTLLHDGVHNYKSWCPLSTPVGKMSGTYEMLSLVDETTFEVTVPEFRLIAPFKEN